MAIKDNLSAAAEWLR